MIGPPGAALLMAVTYVLLMGLLANFITDLLLAKELLQFKLQFIKMMLIYFLAASFIGIRIIDRL